MEFHETSLAYLIGATQVHYHYLDMVPKSRDENGRPYWVHRRDEYDR
jgi:predicted dithiol-disulfide oxidoreductase (DUF899 family)